MPDRTAGQEAEIPSSPESLAHAHAIHDPPTPHTRACQPLSGRIRLSADTNQSPASIFFVLISEIQSSLMRSLKLNLNDYDEQGTPRASLARSPECDLKTGSAPPPAAHTACR